MAEDGFRRVLSVEKEEFEPLSRRRCRRRSYRFLLFVGERVVEDVGINIADEKTTIFNLTSIKRFLLLLISLGKMAIKKMLHRYRKRILQIDV